MFTSYRRDSPCMMTRRRGCLHFQPIQLLLCVMNLSCKCQKLQAKLSFGTPLFQIVNINEDVERKFQHVASSVHKMGMVLDSVQNDVMLKQSHEGGITRLHTEKVCARRDLSPANYMLPRLKGQDDLKALLEGSTKSNPDQMSALNNHTSKLDEILSTLSILKQMQEDLRQLKGDIFRIFTKEMEGIVTLYLKICYLSVRVFPCCPAGSLVRVAYLLCFNRYNAKYSR
ncbi:protein PAIR1-like isoform X2 [Lolium perenne]|uniref:protein PAIR1-like isoform X2 n=1 Tax=Lolium perenne TaxID=4522 RepID=UPI0021F5EFA5|nr:protein PAIR1-like isoform X2 [Lolium perenne]